MATTACFIIVSRNDIPIYEAEVGSATKREDAAQLHQFILHASLDIVQDLAWTTSAIFLKAIDRLNDLVVSVYVTAVHTRLMLLHDSRNDDGIKSFFQEVHELYIKILLNPLNLPGSRILILRLYLTDKFSNAQIICTRDSKGLDELDAVLDVGGVYDPSNDRYDHHQKGFEEIFGHGFSTKLHTITNFFLSMMIYVN
ncbi:hypothetical protein LWI28_017202 [Acer negundo]|uniref:Trafficking protein particle complex subunit 2 n=1 Tax=Acer negundo TaxID=4023 RepID=A0AAD5IRL0_ACENE|nr:hypothetical protein LWI28_017202 [Acer negundo]